MQFPWTRASDHMAEKHSTLKKKSCFSKPQQWFPWVSPATELSLCHHWWLHRWGCLIPALPYGHSPNVTLMSAKGRGCNTWWCWGHLRYLRLNGWATPTTLYSVETKGHGDALSPTSFLLCISHLRFQHTQRWFLTAGVTFFFFLQNKSYKKTFNLRSIQDHTNEHSEAFLRWAAAVLILLFLGGPLRRCSQHSEDEISLHAQSLSLASEGWTSSSGNDLKGSIHIKSLGWKWGAAKVSQNLWDLT